MPPPQDADLHSRLTKEEQSLAARWADAEDALDICQVQSFTQTAPMKDSISGIYRNPQTEAFCQWLGIPNRINTQSVPVNNTKPDPNSPCSTGDEVTRIRQAALDRKRKRAQGLAPEPASNTERVSK